MRYYIAALIAGVLAIGLLFDMGWQYYVGGCFQAIAFAAGWFVRGLQAYPSDDVLLQVVDCIRLCRKWEEYKPEMAGKYHRETVEAIEKVTQS